MLEYGLRENLMTLRNKIGTLPRADGVSDRLVAVALGGRFTDELLSGLPNVLMPTIRSVFGLSYTQVSLLGLTLNYVAAFIEPIGGLLIDIWRRRWLMAFGAAGIGIATAVMGIAPSYAFILLGFAIYGLASGPLAHTSDVVLVDAYPKAPDRIFTRATLLDTFGALLSSLLVSLTFILQLEWRWLMISLGISSLIYAFIIFTTRFPPRQAAGDRGKEHAGRAAWRNLRKVLRSKRAIIWLLFLFVFGIAEAPYTFITIWLREEVGMSQALIGVYIALEMGVSMVSLFFLDRWLARSSVRRILAIACSGVLTLFPFWLFIPGMAARFVLAVPLNFLFAVFWPIGKAQSLRSVPGLGGTTTAVHSLMMLVPIPLLFGLLAERISLTTAMFWVTMLAVGAMILVVWLIPAGKQPEPTVGSQKVA
ncbi:MAG: MFS transporter [Candidatus Promineifilaceae bacterium]